MKARMEGFIAFDYINRYPEAQSYLADLKGKGKLDLDYMILEAENGKKGLDRCVEGLGVLYEGKNYGKTSVDSRSFGLVII